MRDELVLYAVNIPEYWKNGLVWLALENQFILAWVVNWMCAPFRGIADVRCGDYFGCNRHRPLNRCSLSRLSSSFVNSMFY